MISTGTIRKVDKTGRVVVPKGILNEYGIEQLENVGVMLRGEYVVLTSIIDKSHDVRKIDRLSRLPIPSNMRKALKIKPDDLIEVYTSKVEGEILLKKYSVNCEICNGSSNILQFKNKKLCLSCIEEIKRL